jgi:hypothetical protein
MSIFRAFCLLRSSFNATINEVSSNKQACPGYPSKGLLFLSRSDNRVVNQVEIEAYLSSCWGARILKDLHEASFAKKIKHVSKSSLIVIPPGSDNINAFCFAGDQATFCQLTAIPCSALLQSPFTSFAGLRYILPFLDRTVFIESNSSPSTRDLHSGVWSVEAIHQILQRLST